MRRSPIFLLLAWFILVTPDRAHAAVALGAEAGMSFSKFAFDEPRFLPLREDVYGSTTWLRGSLRGRIGLNPHMAVLTGVSYESNGFDVRIDEKTTGTSRLEYAMVPVLFEIQASGGSLRPFGRFGIESGLLIDADEFVTIDGNRGDSGDTDELFSTFEWNLLFGAGVRLRGQWDVHVGYRYGLAHLNDSFNRDAHHFHNRSIVLGLTYWWRSDAMGS